MSSWRPLACVRPSAASLAVSLAALALCAAHPVTPAPLGGVDPRDFGAVGDGVADDTAALQAALDASHGRRVVLARGEYRIRGPLRIHPIAVGPSALPVALVGEGFDGNGGNGGTILRNVGPGNAIELVNRSGVNADNLVVLQGFAIVGDGADAPGGNGIYAERVNNLNLRDLWVQGQRESGIRLVDCWGANVENVTILQNRRHGLYLDRRFNAGVVRRVRAYANGRVYDAPHANVYAVAPEGFEHLGTRFEQIDVSYAGSRPFRAFTREPASGVIVPLIRITVERGVARVATAGAHGLRPGDRFVVSGSTAALGLNSVDAERVAAVPTATTFTFRVTGVADGNYADRTLQIGPAAYGLYLDGAFGASIDAAYAEDCAASAVFLGRVRGFDLSGGYFQNQVVHVRGARNGRIAGAFFTGARGGLLVEGEPRSEIDVTGSNAFAGGARAILPAIAKRDGRYMGEGPPASGAWEAGDQVWRATPMGGAPQGWTCVAPGTPGTWKEMPPLGR